MSPTPSVAVLRWTSVITTSLVQAFVLYLLLADRGAWAAVVGMFGIAMLATQVALFNQRAVLAERRAGELEAELAVARIDPVTGLVLRRVADQYLRDAAGSEVTVALVDVDGLHAINDAVNHDGGDVFLAAVAERLMRVAEPGDLVARLGGDEFVLITSRDPYELAGALTAAIAQPVTIGSATLPMKVSIGICRVPGGDPRTALRCSDLAMFTAKRRGSVIEHYDPARDGVPLSHGVRPPVRHRDRGRTRRPDSSA
jgi:diguanylate cyclase (GGDEF)-like protein